MNILKIALCCLLLLPSINCHSKIDLNSERANIKGIYIGSPNKISSAMEAIKKLDANAVVIDIKNDNGEITANLGVENQKIYIPDIKKTLKTLKEKNIYTIARIVAFKDPIAVGKNPKWAVRTTDGNAFKDKEGSIWLNPYNKEVWKYIIKIAKKAVLIGFDEIQFDYIRFSAYGKNKLDYGELSNKFSKIEIINQFIDYAMENLSPLKVKVSIDVFGCIIPDTLGEDTKISSKNLGQSYIDIAQRVDYICPMIYPSHWPINSLGEKYPDLVPYKIVYKSMEKAIKANETAKAMIRPWLQAFTASWLPKHIYQRYTKIQLDEQQKAAYDLGLSEICFWNSAANYKAF